jgi:hypothetical protein
LDKKGKEPLVKSHEGALYPDKPVLPCLPTPDSSPTGRVDISGNTSICIDHIVERNYVIVSKILSGNPWNISVLAASAQKADDILNLDRYSKILAM